MSSAKIEAISMVSDLIQQFKTYEDIFTPVFLHYNGKSEIITLQYRLKTLFNIVDKNEFFKVLLDQYLENPIKIPSNLFNVQINSQNSLLNLADNKRYFIKLDEINLFHLSNLINIDSEYITIIIDSNFKLDIDSLIVSTISKQPKITSRNVYQYELMSLLKASDFPEKFQCLNIPISFNLILNDFLEYYIPKKYLIAADKWYKMTRFQKGSLRKKNQYSNMIKNRFGINPLEFNNRIQKLLESMLYYIQTNYDDIIKIENIKGNIIPKIPEGYHRIEKTGVVEIRFNFETNFDNCQKVSHSYLYFDFNWMRKLFKKFFNI
ncbi:MAG: hypothetical protein EU535_07345 [Promethearchaeota archaeon]|nr:MAG: hypothetical protein EU535_07345 [Candidatus Lokiarchaeota archaeon]